ncbi:MAG: limonene-1,2-epoxide hydrolase family protein [Rhizomicrobium sp.]
MNTVSNQQKVMNFIAAWEARDIDKILSLMTPDAFYHNIPMQPVHGREAIRGMLGAFLANATDVRWTVHHMAESQAGAVLTERTDVFQMGPKTLSLRVMGTFEFRNGLISAWRDYFDLGQFQSQMA